MLGRRRNVRQLDNGLILTDRAEFHEIAAVGRDGNYHVVEGGHRYRSVFTQAVDEFVRRGIAPPATDGNVRTVTMEELQELYGSARNSIRSEGGADSALSKLDKVLHDAAAANASDVKIIEAGARTVIRIKVGGREFSSGMSWTVSEGAAAMAALFDARDQGTGHPTAMTNVFQSFSVSPGRSKLRLPRGS